ncbi:MAG: helix-turn-helix transcriptional regulator [Candidatus Goldbacteria bacterium]|jgi:putative transcriptional regulator|nr:helix-turn-helix transcriptional regulator [Candidatus Goldiibacteriota bacterium]PKL91606.1 MAG: transcriptional regulator [Candidatus Goldiibacteriota bacterium HGW-Goldbacteria-1]
MENKVRLMRAEKNITQEELAVQLKVTRQTIIAIENGRYDPSLELAFKMSGFFKRPIHDIFTYTGAKK